MTNQILVPGYLRWDGTKYVIDPISPADRTGPPGPSGPPGSQGPQGPSGSSADLSEVLAHGNTTDGYNIVVSTGDVITITDAPTNPTDGTNKEYVDTHGIIKVRSILTTILNDVATPGDDDTWTANVNGSIGTLFSDTLPNVEIDVGQYVIFGIVESNSTPANPSATPQANAQVTQIIQVGDNSSPWIITTDVGVLNQANITFNSLGDGHLWEGIEATVGDVNFYNVYKIPFLNDGIQDVPVSTNAPSDGDVLIYSEADGYWVPQPLVTELIPTQMAFTEVFKQAWFDGATNTTLAPTGLQWVNDTFDGYDGRFTRITEATQGVLAVSGGSATLTHSNGVTHMDLVREGVAIAMPQVMLMVDITARTGTGAGNATVLLGLVKDSDNYIVANWNQQGNDLTIQTKIGGTSHFDNHVAVGSGTVPVTLGFSLVGNNVVVYAKISGTWTKITNKDISTYVDFKAQDLSTWYGAFGAQTPSGGSGNYVYTYDNFIVSRFGGTAARDFCIVTNEDGTPHYTGSSANFTATIVDPLGIGSCAIVNFDFEKKTYTPTGIITINRGGRIQNDNAAHLMIQDDGYQYLTISTWGDTSSPRILLGGVASGTDLTIGSHAITPSQLTLSELPSGGAQWDPFLIRQDTTWYLAYTASPSTPNLFYPVLDRSTDLAAWTNVGKDTTAARYEGTRILKFNNQSYVLTGGQFNMKMYDLTMTYIGIINCISPGNGTTQPHAMIFPYKNLELLITFDEVTWPVGSGVSFAWGSVRWFASPRY